MVVAAALASKIEDRDAIDTAVIEALKDQNALKAYTSKFVPFDPVTKRTAATVSDTHGKTIVVSKGAPQVIADLAKVSGADAEKVRAAVEDLGSKGYRALGVARSQDGGNLWVLLGILRCSIRRATIPSRRSIWPTPRACS